MQSCCISMELEEVEVWRSSFFRVHIVKLIQQDCCMVSVENEGVEKSVTFAFQIGRYRASSTRRMTITPAVMLFLPAWMKWWWWWHLYKWQHYSPRWWHFCKANKLYWLTQLLSDIQSLTISSIPTAEHAGCVYSLHLHVLFPYRDSRYWSDIDHIIKPSVKGVCVWPGIEMGSIKLGKIIFPYFSPYLPSGLKTILEISILPIWWRTVSIMVNGLEYWKFLFSLAISCLTSSCAHFFFLLFQHIQSSDVRYRHYVITLHFSCSVLFPPVLPGT